MQFNENKAIYLQIAERICNEILLGNYGENGRIPSVRDYAARMEVNINTALRSYAHLEQIGIIYQKRGLGYFISPDAKRIIADYHRCEFFGDVLPKVFKSMDMLGISIEEIEKLYKEHRNTTPHTQL